MHAVVSTKVAATHSVLPRGGGRGAPPAAPAAVCWPRRMQAGRRHARMQARELELGRPCTRRAGGRAPARACEIEMRTEDAPRRTSGAVSVGNLAAVEVGGRALGLRHGDCG
eukprot:COSAG02_NODE_133_length_34692_cov_83.845229_1_plen_111_part_10